jgi:hypothetical protein
MHHRCYICGNDNPNVLEEHHIVPRRHGGEDTDENLITLCANCHRSIERIYDKRFYQQLGVESVREGQEERPRHTGTKAQKVELEPVEQFAKDCLVQEKFEFVQKEAVYRSFNSYVEGFGLEAWEFDRQSELTKFGSRVMSAFSGTPVTSRRRGEMVYLHITLNRKGERLLHSES